MVELGVASVGGSTTLHIATKDVNDSVLNFFRNTNKVHVVAAASGTLDLEATRLSVLKRESRWESNLEVITVILVEPLQALDEQEVGRQP